MNRKQFFKIYVLIFIALYSEFNLANEEMFVSIPVNKNSDEDKRAVSLSNQNECSINLSGISGKVILSEKITEEKDPFRNIVIRILGIDYSKSDSIFYEYYPDKNGCFNLPNIPFGSAVVLKVWDTSNNYYTKTINAYANPNKNFYEIPLSLESKILSESRSSAELTQYYNKAGICGRAIGLPPGDLLGTKVFVENTNKKIFAANYSNDFFISSQGVTELSMNGYFCVFNLNSCNINEEFCKDNPNYDLNFILKNGETKKFNLVIPATTFSDNNYFDLSAGVLRPVSLYALKDIEKNVWDKANNIKVSTNNSLMLNLEKFKKLNYFSSGDSFIKINYLVNNKNKYNQFFILKPREEIFTAGMLAKIKNYENYVEGEVFVDEENPLTLKVYDPSILNLSQDDNLNKISNKKNGSIFFSFDLEKYNVDRSFVKVELRNIYGELVLDTSINTDDNVFELLNSNTLSLNGLIYNIEPGFYQLFLKSKERNEKEILYTSLIQSFPGKTQIVTEPYEQSQFNNEQNSYVLSSGLSSDSDNVIPWNEKIYTAFLNSDLLFDGVVPNNSDNLRQTLSEQNEIRNNDLNKYSDYELCGVKDIEEKIDEKSLAYAPRNEGIIISLNEYYRL